MKESQILTIPNLSSWLLIVWGVTCLNPYSDLFAKNPDLFNAMSGLINHEAFWGGLWTAIGIAGMFLGLTRRQRWTAWLMFAAYTAFALLYAIADYSQTGAYFFGSIAIVNFILQGKDQWNRS